MESNFLFKMVLWLAKRLHLGESLCNTTEEVLDECLFKGLKKRIIHCITADKEKEQVLSEPQAQELEYGDNTQCYSGIHIDNNGGKTVIANHIDTLNM